MTIKEIVKQYLKENNYDGLAGDECGCELSDLFPCGEIGAMCEAGHKIPCPGGDDCCVGGCNDWHMVPGKKS